MTTSPNIQFGTPSSSPDGTRLVFTEVVPGTSVMSVSVRTEPTFAAGNSAKLFDGPYLSGLSGSYDVSRDGQKFLMVKENITSDQKTAAAASMIIVLNWFEELKAKLPMGK